MGTFKLISKWKPIPIQPIEWFQTLFALYKMFILLIGLVILHNIAYDKNNSFLVYQFLKLPTLLENWLT